MQKRVSGILLHPTSFPSRYGIGDLGAGARAFIDYLHLAGQRLWQVLPLGPVGYGESPYSSYSSFAGNPLLIDLEELVEFGWLDSSELERVPSFSSFRVDYDLVRKWKEPLLLKAADGFIKKRTDEQQKKYQNFCKEESGWLNDYALFMAVKEYYGEKKLKSKDDSGWSQIWEEGICRREAKAVKAWSQKLVTQIEAIKIIQYFFFSQWESLKQYANQKGIQILGDIPIFVAPDSADVWANREMFLVNANCELEKVAGVPPDYFSPTGQRWGNPLYNWEAMQKDNFQWWIGRIRSLRKRVDLIRIDHFRGFEAYWEIDAEEKTAVNGKWVKVPGEALFNQMKKELGKIPIIAEDLGFITKEVHQLRKKFKFPGMKILQFAFEFNDKGEFNANSDYLPHNYETHSVVYTGTHDNDTTLGWYRSLSWEVQDQVRRYLGRDGSDISWDMIRLALSSPAEIALFPLQDILSYGSDARMNTPSTVGPQNWSWRYEASALNADTALRLKELSQMYGR